MKTRSLILLLLVILLTLSSCDGPKDESTIGTIVAATLEAMGVDEGGEPEGSKSPDATETVSEDPMMLPPTEIPGPGVLQAAYISGENVWFVEEGSAPIQLTTSGFVERVRLSMDGRLAAFIWHGTSPETYELRVVDTSTGTEWTLFSQPELDAIYPLDGAIHHVPYQFEFVPGTHSVLLNTREIFEGPGLMQNNDLWSIEADSSIRTLLLEPGQGGDFYLSPSGEMLALVLPTSLGFARSDGSDRTENHLTFPFVITYSEYAYYPIPVWAQDESGVAVLIPGEDPFVDDTASVWRVPIDEPPALLLDISEYPFFRNSGKTPVISPDLSKVAFLRETSSTTYDLIIAPFDGSPESIVASGSIFWQGWNPDSVQYVYKDGSLNLLLGSVGAPAEGVGFGSSLDWVDVETFLYLDQLTTTHRFGKVDLTGTATVLGEVSGDLFDYDFTQ